MSKALLWVLLGLAMGEALVFWGVVWSCIDAERSENSFCSMCVATSALAAALACAALLFAPHEACVVISVVFLICSMVLQRVCGRRIPPHEDLSSAQSRTRFNMRSSNMLTPGAAAFAFGVALMLNGLILGVDLAFSTALIGIGAGSLAALVTTALRGATPSASSVERVTFPLFGACLLVLPFVPDIGAFRVVLIVLIADLTSYLVFHWNILVLLAYRKQLKPIYHFGEGLIATTVAATLGWIAVAVPAFIADGGLGPFNATGWANNEVPRLIFGEGLNVTLVSCLLAAFVLILVLSIVPYASNRDVENLFSKNAANLRGDDPAVKSAWEIACDDICSENGLTPREREVFAYLARGRNAEHIAGELVISTHTAKTHTGRIYRKLGINSQQQLIDLVENAERKS